MEDSKKNDKEENNLLADAVLAGGGRARKVHDVKRRLKKERMIYQPTTLEGQERINNIILSMEKRYMSLEKRYLTLKKRYKKVARSTKKP